MRHKWVKQSDIKHTGMPTHFVWLCCVCGCQKVVGNYRFATPHYERSGQVFDHYIECIDEKAEKLKTID